MPDRRDPREPVREYLERFFAGAVTDVMDPAAHGPLFRVLAPDGTVRHEVVVDPAFLEARTGADVARFLSEHQLFDVLRQEGRRRVRVSDAGITATPPAQAA